MPEARLGDGREMQAPVASGIDCIRKANSRPIGRIEFRQVVMEIGAGRRSRRLYMRTLRESNHCVARSLFCVMEPRTLSNINYTAIEQRGCIVPFEIQLYLPYVLGTLRKLPSERRKQALLGSNFGYDDLRVWLYETGHRYELLETVGSLLRVRGQCTVGSHLVRHGPNPFEVWLSDDSYFVQGIDFLSADGSEVVRRYRADEAIEFDGILVPTRMTMTDSVSKDRTTIILERCWHDRPIDEKIFEPSFRKRTRDYLAAL